MRTHDTYLAHSFQQTKRKQCSEVSGFGHDGGQQRQNGRPADSEHQQEFAANLLCQRSPEDLSRRVAVEERS